MQSLGLLGLVFDTGLGVTPLMCHLGYLASHWRVPVGSTKPTFEFPTYKLRYNVEFTILIHKIIVSIVARAHELRCEHIKAHQDVGKALLQPCNLSGLPL